MNPLFEGIIVNNTKDLANFNIMTLHEKLNKSNKVYVKNNYNYIWNFFIMF